MSLFGIAPWLCRCFLRFVSSKTSALIYFSRQIEEGGMPPPHNPIFFAGFPVMNTKDYDSYVARCEAMKVKPLPLGPDLVVVQSLWALGPDFIPYLSSMGSVWVRNTRHKTGRQDRPFNFANAGALGLG